MKRVDVRAEVDLTRCRACKTCEMVCPVYAVHVHKTHGQVQVEMNESRCVGCWNCEQRCPEHAVRMVPFQPRLLGTDPARFDQDEIAALCRKARFHPKQGVCYCSGSRAEELAAAVLAGASSPDELVLATGVGAGCGIECNQAIQRFLKAAGRSFERPAKSFQWYGLTPTVWDVPAEVSRMHPTFRFEEDRQLLDRVVAAPLERRR